jgi:PAS domain S-box-containing protein
MGQPIRVLHVDDDEQFASTSASFLETEDEAFEVVTETSATDGLDRVDSDPVDCVVSDYQMPGTDGIEFLERVRERRPDLPFILFTGEGSETVAGEAISAGATDYLQKGSGTEQYELLANRVRNAVESRRNRRAVERSRARLRTVVDFMPHPLYVVDEAGRYLLVNEALADLHDRSVAEIEGTTVTDVLGGDLAERFLEDVRGVVESSEDKRIPQVTMTDADGEEHVLEPRLVPFEFPATEGPAVLGMAVDVTERERRREETERVREQLRTLIDTVPAAVYVEDLDGRFRLANDFVAETLADGDVTDVEGRPIDEVLPEAVADRLVESNRAVAESDSPVSGEEFTISTTGGDRVFRRYAAPVRDDEGAAYAVCGVSVDVTDEHERRRELERQNERLDEFAGIISHDLRNPLTVARGRIPIIAEECDSEHLEAVADALDRIERILEDTLALAREGETVGETEPVDSTALAGECWETLGTDDAALSVEPIPSFEADPDRLRRALENLYRNAIEHGGRDVSIRVGPLDDGFYVADDGPGIPPGDRADVFEPGYTTADEGTGFGLSIVAEIVDAHGWAVSVTDADGGGARFEISGVEWV